MKATLSILGLWRWDETLFDNMSLPDGVDLDTVRDNILYSLGNLEVLYPSAPFMKRMIELWSKTELPTWSKLYEAMQLEYNPLENYDRIEEWTDTRDDTRTLLDTLDGEVKNTGTVTNVVDAESHDTGTDTVVTDDVSQNYIAGYNEPSVVLSSQTEVDRTVTDTKNLTTSVDNTTTDTYNTKVETDNTRNATDSLDGETVHTGRVHGNIGVTTSQQMLKSELDLVPQLNIINYIVHSFKMRFCVLVY